MSEHIDREIAERVLGIAQKLHNAAAIHYEDCWRVHDACALRRAHDIISMGLTPIEQIGSVDMAKKKST